MTWAGGLRDWKIKGEGKRDGGWEEKEGEDEKIILKMGLSGEMKVKKKERKNINKDKENEVNEKECVCISMGLKL